MLIKSSCYKIIEYCLGNCFELLSASLIAVCQDSSVFLTRKFPLSIILHLRYYSYIIARILNWALNATKRLCRVARLKRYDESCGKVFYF